MAVEEEHNAAVAISMQDQEDDVKRTRPWKVNISKRYFQNNFEACDILI